MRDNGTRERTMTGPADFLEGQPVIYKRTQRGGYGFVYRIPSVVLAVGPKRVQVEYELERGGMKSVWVDPKNLEAVSG